VNLWEFYRRLVATAREVDPEFPEFDHACFVEGLVEIADMLWEGRRPYVRGFRDEEWRATLTLRDRLWHWLLRTVWWGSYGGGVLWPTGVACAQYDPATPEVAAPVPAAQVLLGGPAVTIEFTEDESARVRRCYWLERREIEAAAKAKQQETRT